MDQTQEAIRPEAWVPVDRRRLGLDRRTIGPALTVLLLAVLLAVVIPAVDLAGDCKARRPTGKPATDTGRSAAATT